jgi:hypothetical protein
MVTADEDAWRWVSLLFWRRHHRARLVFLRERALEADARDVALLRCARAWREGNPEDPFTLPLLLFSTAGELIDCGGAVGRSLVCA